MLLGAAGLPVFAAGKGGLGVLAGPTGGFLLGFIAGVFLGALVRTRVNRMGSRMWADVMAVAVTLVVTYTLGWLHLAIVTGLGPSAALAAGVAPFVVFDVVKAVIAIMLATAIRRARTTEF